LDKVFRGSKARSKLVTAQTAAFSANLVKKASVDTPRAFFIACNTRGSAGRTRMVDIHDRQAAD